MTETSAPVTPKYLAEFPDFGPLDVTIPDGFDDASWHNDGCPCWIHDELHLRLMIDYADRSIGPYLRFIVGRLSDDNQVTQDTSDDCHAFAAYDEALAVILAEQFVAELKSNLTVKAWEELRRRNREYATKGDTESCASHEFCDPNMDMQDAMVSLGLLNTDDDLQGDWASERTPESKRLVGLWNAAWAYAKRTHLTAD